MEVCRWMSCLLMGTMLCGCGGSGRDEPDDVPIPVAAADPPGRDDVFPLPNGGSSQPEIPASFQHPTLGGGDAEGLRTGPFALKLPKIEFSVPSGWKEVAVSEMAKRFGTEGRLRIPAGGSEIELTFSRVGGGIAENVKRWQGQFSGSDEPGNGPKSFIVDGVKTTYLDLRGTYDSGMPGASPVPDQRMLAAGFPIEPQEFYLKLVGPRDAVAEIADEFKKFVQSAKIED